MSGKPNPDGVKKLRQLLRDVSWTRGRIASLKHSIREYQIDLESQEEQLRRTNEGISEAMTEMDVAAPGNHGYAQRHFEMMLMLAEPV
jgi:hypothetical protein